MRKEFIENDNQKKQEIIDLQLKLEDMSNEFARMLRVFIYNLLSRKHQIKCKRESNLLNGIVKLTIKP